MKVAMAFDHATPKAPVFHSSLPACAGTADRWLAGMVQPCWFVIKDRILKNVKLVGFAL